MTGRLPEIFHKQKDIFLTCPIAKVWNLMDKAELSSALSFVTK